MKYLKTSLGPEIGFSFEILLLKLCSRDPSEKTTFANLAVETGIFIFLFIKNIFIILLLAPIMLIGFVALSVDTQKYFLKTFHQ